MHWLKQKCVRGDNCDFLHVYDESKMPVCKYWQKEGDCPNRFTACVYRHPVNENGYFMGNPKKQEICPYFSRGFCKLRDECGLYHYCEKAKLCVNYLMGFCPIGQDDCPDYHLKRVLNPSDISLQAIANMPDEYNWP